MRDIESPTRRLLLMGFGGLLLLLAFAGLNGISAVRTIEDSNERIRQDYLARERVLEQLRSDIYLSGTYVRDFLFESDPTLSELPRKEFEAARSRVQANVTSYVRIQSPAERVPFERFASEVNRYFRSLEPALRWDSAQRQQLGRPFMKSFLLPRRQEIVHLADQLSRLNQQQLEAGNQQVHQLFRGFQRSLLWLTILSLACGIALAGVSMQRLLRLERSSATHLQEVLQTRTALQDLSARLLQVQESERRALSRELHDEVGQSVSGLLLGIGNVAATLSPEVNTVALAQLQELRRVAEKVVAVVRDLSLLLRPSMLDDLGLLPALQWQAREVSRTRNMSVQVFAEEALEGTVSEEQKTCIYRVVQEALQNVVRHAQAKSVAIHVREEEKQRLVLSIEDDGCGFQPTRERGVGLLGMEERVRHLNGRFSVTSQLGRGATICVELPLPESSKGRIQ